MNVQHPLHSQGVTSRETTNLPKRQELSTCLQDCFRIDGEPLNFILDKCTPLLQNVEHTKVIDAFIAKAKELNIDFSVQKDSPPLPADDAVLASPGQHEVVFDSPYVRVLWSNTKPGELEPLHRHPFKRLILSMREACFEVCDGLSQATEVQEYKIGVYEGEPGEYYSCKNLGPGEEACLGFEIK